MDPRADAPSRPSVLGLLFGLREPVGPATYAVVGFGLATLKYAVDAAVVLVATGRWWTPLDALRPTLGARPDLPTAVALALVAWTLPFLWIGASTSVRRAHDAGLPAWTGLGFFVPVLNYAWMLTLCLLPSRRGGGLPDPGPPAVGPSLAAALQAVAVGAGAALVVLLVATELVGGYGLVLFLGAPFALGTVAGWLYNRDGVRDLGATVGVAALATLVAAGATLLFALEGLLCLVMALPLATPLALLGGLLGRALAAVRAPGAPAAAAALLALPLVAGLEPAAVEPAGRAVVTAVEVDAPPERVWRHVVAFAELPPPRWAPFRLGIAHPRRARIEGEGVGAVRRCEFSTGAFVEPITAWEPPRRLAFDVAEQPPTMRELSPWPGVRPPHLGGAVRSLRGEFRLEPLAGGRTRLVGATWLTVELRPAWYWAAWTELFVHRIHRAVLEHVAALAEAEAGVEAERD